MYSLHKMLLAFAQLHLVFQDQTCLLLQVSLDFLTFAFQSPMMKRMSFSVLVLEGVVTLYRTSEFSFFGISACGIGLDYWDVEWSVLETNILSVIFQIAPKYCILDSLLACEGYSTSSKGEVVDIMVIWLKFSPPVHFSSLILKMMLTLAISHLATSNSPWFMDLTVYAIVFFAPLDFTFTTRHIISCAVGKGCLLGLSRKIEHCFCFGSAASCFLELFVFAFLSFPIAHWTSSDLGAHLAVSYLFAFSYSPWGSSSENPGVVCHSLLWGTTFCHNSPLWPLSQVALYIMALGFMELCKPLHHDEAVIYEGVSFLTP